MLLSALLNSGALITPFAGMIVLFALFGILLIGTVISTVVILKKQKGGLYTVLLVLMYLATVMVLICSLLGALVYFRVFQAPAVPETTVSTTEATTEATTQPTTEPTEPPTEETTVPPTEPDPTFDAVSSAVSDPANWGIRWDILPSDGADNFQREDIISFSDPSTYFALPGIAGFRGDHYRTGASYGTAQVENKTIDTIWTNSVGSLANWNGIGWTGQPLVVQWDEQTLLSMNLREEKKLKDNLVEVIATTLDGNIYFYDLTDGTYTRDPIHIGQSVKGTAALDPRGYPILYVGAGLNTAGSPKMFMINLLDNSIMYQQAAADPQSNRTWSALDSSPLICAEADTLIWPCENGLIYTMKLNTVYDKAAGILSIDPQPVVKTRYSSNTGRTIGFESSCITVGSYAYVGDNGGLFFCIDLNTMELVWAQNVRDDVNATPVFEWGKDGNGYLYITTSMEYAGGTAYVYKINAATGEIVWEVSYSGIVYDKNVSGGSLSSPVLGKEGTDLEGMLIVSISKTHNYTGGIVAALDTETGETVWENKYSNYAWSSPVAVYTQEGAGYILLGDSAGVVRLLDATGEVLDTVNTGSNIEASPVVFNNILVVGTRGGKVYGIKIS